MVRSKSKETEGKEGTGREVSEMQQGIWNRDIAEAKENIENLKEHCKAAEEAHADGRR